MSWWTTWLTDVNDDELKKYTTLGPLGPVVRPPSRRPFQCLVTDMDECLIHTWDTDVLPKKKYMQTFNTPEAYPFRHMLFGVEMNARNPNSLIYGIFRPGLIDFLNYAFNRFDYVVLWSAGTSYYVHQITEYMFSKTDRMPDNVFARPFCENHTRADEEYLIKPLKKLQQINPAIQMSNMFFLDDNPDVSVLNRNNHLLIPKWNPDPTVASCKAALAKDRYLYDLIEWLERPEVKSAVDVRRLDKRRVFKLNA
jgi:TFIIF-interacting CTD phosphatase-like protein